MHTELWRQVSVISSLTTGNVADNVDRVPILFEISIGGNFFILMFVSDEHTVFKLDYSVPTSEAL